MTRIKTRTITRRALLAGSAAAGGLATLGAPAIAFAQAQARPVAGKWDALAKHLRGDLITPSTSSYDAARQLWNGMIDKHPAAIARCTGAADVMTAIKFARDNDIPVSVRGGGHNVAGKSLRDGALTIDLAAMHNVRVDPVTQRAYADGGARWATFDHETLAFDLATTGGTVSTTGVGGLTLGGGLGWLMRKHGLSCDNLVGADVITADGRMMTAGPDQNDDLFWALRGGGGNFGVVTSFEFKLHPLEPIVGGIAMYPEKNLKDVLRFFRDYTATAPDAVTAMAGIFAGPPGTPLEGQNAGFIAVCHSGALADAERALQPIKDLEFTAIDTIGPMPYATLQTMFDAGAVSGGRHYWRSSFMKEFDDDVIDLILARADEMPPPGTMLLVEHLGGAVSRVGEHETAFANRGAQYNVSLLAGWADAADDEKNIAWTRKVGDEFKAFSTGGAYVNYMASDESAANVKAAYESNFQRLVDVKRKYDPDNFFSGNQNIVP